MLVINSVVHYWKVNSWILTDVNFNVWSILNFGMVTDISIGVLFAELLKMFWSVSASVLLTKSITADAEFVKGSMINMLMSSPSYGSSNISASKFSFISKKKKQ